jgi:Fe-S-cluster-containing hydrogenase component 2
MDPATQTAAKCDLCKGEPACARFCPSKALEYATESQPQFDEVEVR